MKIIFMGTAEFAVPTLQELMNSHEILAVVTAPDKAAGRGHKVQIPEVKKFALARHLNILQPKNLKSKLFINQLKKLNADIIIVVAFRMLPEIVWSIPPYGSVNLHASLLPAYRGAAPIQRAIMNGESRTGLTVFKLNREIDTGDIILQKEVAIGPDETGGELHDKLKYLGGGLLLKSLELLKHGNIQFLEQDDRMATSAPKIFRDDCKINWKLPVDVVYNHIRALCPYPGAWFIKDDVSYKIYNSRKIIHVHEQHPSTMIISDNELHIACKNGYINVLEIQAEGKRKMTATEFINGLKNRKA